MEGVGSDHWAKVLVDNAALARSGTGTGTGDGDLDWVSVAQSSMALADSLRTPALRTTVGSNSATFESLSALFLASLSASSQREQVLMCQLGLIRVVGNLCLDHPDNRLKSLSHDVPASIFSVLSSILSSPASKSEKAPDNAVSFSITQLKAIRAGMGAILNLCIDCPQIRQSILATPTSQTALHPLTVLSQIISTSLIPIQSQSQSPATVEPIYGLNEWWAEGADEARSEVGRGCVEWSMRIMEELIGEDGSKRKLLPIVPISLALFIVSSQDAPPPSKRLSSSISASSSSSSQPGRRLEGEFADELESDIELLTTASELLEAICNDDDDPVPVGQIGVKSTLISARISFPISPVPSSQGTKSTSGSITLAWLKSIETLSREFRVPLASEQDTSLISRILHFIQDSSPPNPLSHVQPSSTSTPSSTSASRYPKKLAKEFSKLKGSLSRSLISSASEDSVMNSIFDPSPLTANGRPIGQDEVRGGWIIRTLVGWLAGGGEEDDVEARDDLVVTAAVMLGNLARSDVHCVTLVKDFSLATVLASRLGVQAEVAKAKKGAPGETARILHALLSLLKNLSIAGPNKEPLGDAGVISPASEVLKDGYFAVPVLQNAAIGALKHLCAGNVSNSLRIVEPSITSSEKPSASAESALALILALASSTSDPRLKYEATRLLVNLIRSLWSTRVLSPTSPIASLGSGLDGALAKENAKKALTTREVAEALAEMVRTAERYPVLINEGIMGLTLLATVEAGAVLVADALVKHVDSTVSQAQVEDVESAIAQLNQQPRSNTFPTPVAGAPSTQAPPSASQQLSNWLEGARRNILNDETATVQAKKTSVPPEMVINVCVLLETITRAQEISAETKYKMKMDLAGPLDLLVKSVGTLEGTSRTAEVALGQAAAQTLGALSRS